ncbi:polysaccharide pyruvyl transferase family protein [Aliiroseovarius crassostreae]|uniref:Polysaccharide pyruvyl transferase family protein n=1 Tax=Aliiroseovarius crassostreae TaxID=154981 RepID=A0A9Q9M0N5_9RHOB|nr:polysaccharide pyruvyl transferase family protein [Aliiroseovarius crassostreae]UWP96678.1 polysaccharide pyruvyl transferase family protein [Aliiroseovarius crassostreae]UWP99794.1 polysaccharide pyruvyl transferase family protein [Aliiroseovarius crassostreae]
MSATPLKLYWWKDEPNFGDDLSREVVSFVSGREVSWAPKDAADMVALGSVLQGVRNRFKDGSPKGNRPVIWGTGLMFPVPKDFLPYVETRLVRGPLTATFLGLKHNQFGDPGLLAQEALGAQGERIDRIGIIPHMKHVDSPELAAVLAAEPALFLIDPRRSAREVVAEIARCAHVISSSLHGLVVADSFGIPNTWLEPVAIHAMPKLKFYDYATGIERPLACPVKLTDIPAWVTTLKDQTLSYQDGIEASKASLLAAFPASLRAQDLAALDL